MHMPMLFCAPDGALERPMRPQAYEHPSLKPTFFSTVPLPDVDQIR